MNEFDFTTMIPQVDLFSFVFWKKLKTSKRHFEINWPLLSTNLPHLSHIVIEWPPMYSSPSLSQSTYSVCLYSTSLVIMRISDIRMISQSENYHAQAISKLQVDYQFLFNYMVLTIFSLITKIWSSIRSRSHIISWSLNTL